MLHLNRPLAPVPQNATLKYCFDGSTPRYLSYTLPWGAEQLVSFSDYGAAVRGGCLLDSCSTAVLCLVCVPRSVAPFSKHLLHSLVLPMFVEVPCVASWLLYCVLFPSAPSVCVFVPPRC